jgi:uncharacterized protein YkwD
MRCGMAAAIAALLHTAPAEAAGAPADAVRARCPDASLNPTAGDRARVARATVCLLNVERLLHHLGSLRANRALTRIASRQAQDMVRGNYFADNSITGRTPLERITPALLPARVTSIGQNIAWGAGQDATPARIVEAWMQSPPHRRIILTRAYREAGVGIAPALPAVLEEGSEGATYALDISALAH